jgi:hypothetical protein
MSTKLTLTIDPDVIERAKRVASQQGRSLSDIVENYLKVISTEVPKSSSQLSPTLKSLKGSFKEADELDYKDALSESLAKKYL